MYEISKSFQYHLLRISKSSLFGIAGTALDSKRYLGLEEEGVNLLGNGSSGSIDVLLHSLGCIKMVLRQPQVVLVFLEISQGLIRYHLQQLAVILLAHGKEAIRLLIKTSFQRS